MAGRGLLLMRPRRMERRSRWPSRVATHVLRTMALVLALQFSGAAHHALDLARALDLVSAVEQQCSHEEQGDDCPPGCPACHCGHAAPAVPSSPSVPTWMRAFSRELAPTPHEATGPPKGLRASVYRPPRRDRST